MILERADSMATSVASLAVPYDLSWITYGEILRHICHIRNHIVSPSLPE